MKQKLRVLLPALMCLVLLSGCMCSHEWAEATCTSPKTCTKCEKTEGETLAHEMVEANCIEAKHCANCDLTEGEPLGHDWKDATTEDPQTCLVCALTQGERIITDPRFTTAATQMLQGKWSTSMYLDGKLLGYPDFTGVLECNYALEYGPAGDLDVSFELKDPEAFMDALVAYTLELSYANMESMGLSREDAEVAIQQSMGMTMEEYARSIFAAIDLEQIFQTILSTLEGVYYVEGDQLYTGADWDTIINPVTFYIEGDVLHLDIEDKDDVLGMHNGLKRVTQ